MYIVQRLRQNEGRLLNEVLRLKYEWKIVSEWNKAYNANAERDVEN